MTPDDAAARGFVEPAPAKLNLALHVRGRRADGYHELETIFAFTAFGDTLRYAPAAALSLTVEGEYRAAAGTGDDNLVLRAARALAAAAGVQAAGALTLAKRIPVAAGLGGGSADAAAALRLLNRVWGLGLPTTRLVELAAGLGADVPACVESRSCLGTGTGERLQPLDLGLDGTPLLIVNPRVAVPTGPVFALWDGIDHGALDPSRPLSALRNDLAAPAIRIAPVIGEVLGWLEAQPGATLTRMSGSGASAFALFTSADAAIAAQRSVPPAWWSMATRLGNEFLSQPR